MSQAQMSQKELTTMLAWIDQQVAKHPEQEATWARVKPLLV